MRITVSVHGHFKDTSSVGQEQASYSFPDGTGMRIRDLMTTLNIIDEEVRQILMNGRSVRLDEMVRHRVHLEFYPKDRSTATDEAAPAGA